MVFCLSTGNGTIEFEELKKLMRKSQNLAVICRKDKQVEEEEIRRAFKVFDKDGNGYICANDLKMTMKQLGVELTSDDVKAMMSASGVQEDGRIYYEGQLHFLSHSTYLLICL